ENLVGFFVNTIVLRSQVEPSHPFSDFLATVRETVLEGFAHDDLPFDRLVEALQPERDPSRTPLVQVMIVLQNVMVRPREIDGLHAPPLRGPGSPKPSGAGGGLRQRGAELPRAQPAGQQARTSPSYPWRGARDPGRHLHGALVRPGGGNARDPQGGRRLRPPR